MASRAQLQSDKDVIANLRRWLHRIDEATNSAVAHGPEAAAINRAAMDALAGKPAPSKRGALQPVGDRR